MEQDFQKVTTRILKEQAKLGKLKRLSVKVQNFSEAKRAKLKAAGLLGVTLLSAAGLTV